jgi:hypothetical protein
MYEERIIGYDAREMPQSSEDWSPQRREMFLLDKSVLQPLSVDPHVWKPVENWLSLQVWTGPRQGWDQLTRLEDFLARGKYRTPYWIVAITQLIDVSDTELMEEYPQYRIAPLGLAGDWSLIGYDVADFYGTSFLTNAGFEDNEPVVLNADKWIERLNEYHLFRSESDALEYVDVAYERDASHGPFYVYGLYKIRTIE